MKTKKPKSKTGEGEDGGGADGASKDAKKTANNPEDLSNNGVPIKDSDGFILPGAAGTGGIMSPKEKQKAKAKVVAAKKQ